MRNILTIFVFAFVFGTFNASAQDIDAIRAISAEQTKELRNDIKTLSSEQKSLVYEAFKTYNKRKAILEDTKGKSTEIEANEMQLRTTMQKILDSEQFKMFLRRYKVNKQ